MSRRSQKPMPEPEPEAKPEEHPILKRHQHKQWAALAVLCLFMVAATVLSCDVASVQALYIRVFGELPDRQDLMLLGIIYLILRSK